MFPSLISQPWHDANWEEAHVGLARILKLSIVEGIFIDDQSMIDLEC